MREPLYAATGTQRGTMNGRGANLEHHVGGVEVPVADALAMDVVHARHNICENEHYWAPSTGHVFHREEPLRHRVPQTTTIAELLHGIECETHSQSFLS